jgi:hypothetical protein
MRTATVNVFQFGELAPRAKEKARAWYRQGAFDHDWWEFTVEDAKTCFKLVGFDISNVPFSGFSSQGDGACFEGTWRARDVKPGELQKHAPEDEELHRIAAGFEAVAKQYPGAFFKVRHSWHHYHQYSATFEFEFLDNEGNEIEDVRTAEKDLIDLARAAMKWTYRQLEKEYEYQSSDEQVDVSIEANEYEFTDDGKRWTRT